MTSVIGCTTWYQIHGPYAGVGFESDRNEGSSPTLHAGYAFERYKPFLGYGFSGGVTYSAVAERLDVNAELHGMGYLLPLPVSVGPVYSMAPEGDFWGITVGFEMLWTYPPNVCAPPLEGQWAGCPGGSMSENDVLYPAWLPRNHMRSNIFFDREPESCPVGQPDCGYFTMGGSVDVVLSSYWLFEGERQPAYHEENPYDMMPPPDDGNQPAPGPAIPQ